MYMIPSREVPELTSGEGAEIHRGHIFTSGQGTPFYNLSGGTFL